MPPLWGHFLYPYRSADRVSQKCCAFFQQFSPRYSASLPLSSIIYTLDYPRKGVFLPLFSEIIPERVQSRAFFVYLPPIRYKSSADAPPYLLPHLQRKLPLVPRHEGEAPLKTSITITVY